MKNSKGFAYLLVVAAVLAATVFSLTLSNLNQGFRKQVCYVAHKDASFEIAYSVLSGIMAKVYAKPWSERFFSPTPAIVNDKTILNGTYDFLVEDSPGKGHQFDAYIRVNLNGQKRVFFWRIAYHDHILDISPNFSKIYFTNLHENELDAGTVNEIAAKVDRILKNRELNRENSENLASILKGSNNSKDIAKLLGAPEPAFPDNDFQDFNPLQAKAPELPAPPSISPSPVEEPPNVEQPAITIMVGETQVPVSTIMVGETQAPVSTEGNGFVSGPATSPPADTPEENGFVSGPATSPPADTADTPVGNGYYGPGISPEDLEKQGFAPNP